MDKRTATLTLAEKLKELGYSNQVKDTVMKSYLLDNAKSVVLDLEEGRLKCKFYYPNGRDEPSANYFFNILEGEDTWVTSVALIGEVEEKILRKKFYKNVPDEVVKAFEVLEISHFIEHYKTYSLLSEDNFPDDCTLYPSGETYIPFKKWMEVGIKDIIKGTQSKKYYLVNKVIKDKGIEGYRFEDELLNKPDKENRYANCDFDNLIPVKKRFSSEDFLNFVFSLPYEDQNITANKMLLKNMKDINFCEVLLKEYLEDKHFKDYFSVLDEDRQKKVVDKIRDLPEQNKFLNSWLFSQGFTLELDYLELYKEDSGNFIDYFNKSSDKVQKLIVSDIFNCEHTNQEVIEFLEKKHPDLLRDTAFKE